MENQNQSLTPSSKQSPMKASDDGINRSIQTTGSTSAEMVAEQTRAEVQGAMTLAKKFPRNEESARQAIIASCQSIKFAEKAVYKKPVGKLFNETTKKWEQNYVEGPSIRFAEEMLRHWGNVKTQEFIIYEDPTRRLVRVICYDLQSNNSYSEDILIEKTVERKSAKGREVISERTNSYGEVIHIVVATEDEVRNKEKAMVSKAIRNNGLRLIPVHIVEEAVNFAKEVIASGIGTNIDVSLKKMLESFADINVFSKDIEQYIKHPISKITVSEIADLKTVYRSIKDGEAKWSDYVLDVDSQEIETAEIDQEDAKDWDELERNIQKGDESTHTAVDKKVGKGKKK